MAKIIPQIIIEHCAECSLIDTTQCPHSNGGVDLFNYIPKDCPLDDAPTPDDYK